jgi:hypothetical protein
LIDRADELPVTWRSRRRHELKPATPHQFHFWTAVDAEIGIGAIVRVDGKAGRVVHGVITDGFAFSDLATPLHDVVGAEGDPARAGTAATARQEVRLWTAAVLRQEPAEPLRPSPWAMCSSRVMRTSRWWVEGYVGVPRSTGIPVGLYTAGGLEAPVYLDADFLLGPEAAHLNISGVSGLATKTSAVEFLLASIFKHYPAHKGSVAAVCFNVKGPDLCYLDQPGELDEEDLRRYARLDVPPQPWGAPGA